jgi:hypothetical protein
VLCTSHTYLQIFELPAFQLTFFSVIVSVDSMYIV